MEGKTLARIGAAAFAGIAVTAAAIEMTREEKPVVPVTVEVTTAPIDPMREALARCQFMGEVAPRDSGCLKTWAENRRRFLGLEPVAAPRPNGER
ncbi:MAG TPA: putative entry exclusion protein TrbK-alt [Sphingomonas sanguinis]|uniref:putative entry exclusion protein TrbK-alt n=1 Tax=Sphingomonas sanguinis TaxID=33051 RepID=UPI002ABF97B7|nr:putative entry exclusion protein TrbK-alt [Sphingomonas sanguinis]HJO67404.1 putative entry exclusion protein TrbK-alt [Sphingomonas sanguinis]